MPLQMFAMQLQNLSCRKVQSHHPPLQDTKHHTLHLIQNALMSQPNVFDKIPNELFDAIILRWLGPVKEETDLRSLWRILSALRGTCKSIDERCFQFYVDAACRRRSDQAPFRSLTYDMTSRSLKKFSTYPRTGTWLAL